MWKRGPLHAVHWKVFVMVMDNAEEEYVVTGAGGESHWGGVTHNDVIILSYQVNNRHPHTSLFGEEGLPAVGGARVYSSLCATMEVRSCFVRQQLSAYLRAACAPQLFGRGGSLLVFSVSRMVSSNGMATMDRWRQCVGVDVRCNQ